MLTSPIPLASLKYLPKEIFVETALYNCPRGFYGNKLGKQIKCTTWCPAVLLPEGTAEPILAHLAISLMMERMLCIIGISTLNSTLQLDQGVVQTKPHAAKVQLPCQDDRSCCFKYTQADVYDYDLCDMKCTYRYNDEKLDDSEFSSYCQCSTHS